MLTTDQQNDVEEEILYRCDQKCADDALYWAQVWTKTENSKHQEMGLPFRAPLPNKKYFRPLFEAFASTKLLMIPKSRDMMTSWSGMVWAAHEAQWNSSFTIIQSMKDAKAQELVACAAILYQNQPDWLKLRHPLESQTLNEVRWKNGGRVLGVPAGADQIRTYHPTCYIMDEAAFLPEAQACWNTVKAAGTPQMIAISSAGPGWFAEMCAQ